MAFISSTFYSLFEIQTYWYNSICMRIVSVLNVVWLVWNLFSVCCICCGAFQLLVVIVVGICMFGDMEWNCIPYQLIFNWNRINNVEHGTQRHWIFFMLCYLISFWSGTFQIRNKVSVSDVRNMVWLLERLSFHIWYSLSESVERYFQHKIVAVKYTMVMCVCVLGLSLNVIWLACK